jgi:signal transduction histidine kinase
MPGGERRVPILIARMRDLGPAYWRGHWRKVLMVKVAGVCASIPLVMALDPDRHTRNLFVFLAGGIYLPVSLFLYLVQRRRPAPPNAEWFAVTLSDIGVVAVTQSLFPHLSVAFPALTAIVMVSAVLLGVRLALLVAGTCAGALFAAIEVGASGQPSRFSAVMGTVLMVAMAYLIGTLAEHERRAADQNHRLVQAIGSVISSLELSEVLTKLCESAREAMGSGFAVVLTLEDDRLVFRVGVGQPPSYPTGDIPLHLGRSTGLPVSAMAVRTMEPVIIEDTDRDERFPELPRLATALGARAGAAIPIVHAGRPIGVLNVYLPNPARMAPDDVEFLVALAEQAGLAMERARLYASEREAAERLRELDRLRSEFVSTVSHELRTPLTAIEGFAQTLRNRWRQVPDELRDEMIERLVDNSRSLEHLITHLLDFGRLERGEFHVQPEPHDVGELVHRALANMVHELSGHRVVTDIPEGLAVDADRFAFDRILGNLLSNAAKFSPEGSVIEVAAERRGGEVVLTVRDHGPGIPNGAVDRVFERFYRGHQWTRGTGIGLAVAKDLTELHGGTISASNAPDGGAAFVVVLPAAAQPEPEGIGAIPTLVGGPEPRDA